MEIFGESVKIQSKYCSYYQLLLLLYSILILITTKYLVKS